MIRIAKESAPERLKELKKKIDDEIYMHKAIASIAHTLTKEFVIEKKR